MGKKLRWSRVSLLHDFCHTFTWIFTFTECPSESHMLTQHMSVYDWQIILLLTGQSVANILKVWRDSFILVFLNHVCVGSVILWKRIHSHKLSAGRYSIYPADWCINCWNSLTEDVLQSMYKKLSEQECHLSQHDWLSTPCWEIQL